MQLLACTIDMDNKKLVYCLECDHEVEYIQKDELEECKIKSVTISYVAHKAYCSKCNHPLFVYELEKVNQINRFDEYKRKRNLLTSQEIIAIRKKYGLSQTKLARLIKCGAKNIARYELGAIQDSSIDLLIRF